MLVYGDLERRESAAALRGRIRAMLAAASARRGSIAGHAALVSALVEAGGLVQGIADAEFARSGADHPSSVQRLGNALLLELARAVCRSWQSGFCDGAPLPHSFASRLERLDSPGTLAIRQAEGHALYALYPESYIAPALRSGLGPNTVAIGIRSIGTTLAAMVAAALGCRPALTVRPVGPPFRRRIASSAALDALIVSARNGDFAIVDEGPGLSGSSFGAVADWLQSLGVPEERIHFFPSHDGALGDRADPAHRRRWEDGRRHPAAFEPTVLAPALEVQRLESWVESLLGPLAGPLEEVSGGRWRRHRRWRGTPWPAADTQNERRKIIARADGATWLVKFAGLGPIGQGKLARARRLELAGLGPPVAGYCHGFLVERWLGGAAPIAAAPRHSQVEALGRYLGFRARLPPLATGGASAHALVEMARVNAAEALGEPAGARLAADLAGSGLTEWPLEACDTDNRLHGWEWLVLPGGRILKSDGLDHGASHDLVGSQDIAWDLAGAAIEFRLNPIEKAALRTIVADESSERLAPGIIAALELCYLAFQTGLWRFAAESNGGTDRHRAAALSESYARVLGKRIGAGLGVFTA